MFRTRSTLLGVTLGLAGAWALWHTIDPDAGRRALAEPAPESRPAGANPLAGFPDLTKGLLETDGCLGVESARTATGKSVIFAWFENKAAAMRWYDSRMHQGAMRTFFPQGSPTDQPELAETRLPISQIAIELYTPLNGGLFLGGRFAPDDLAVGDMADYGKPEDTR